jgi:hypothetical protein
MVGVPAVLLPAKPARNGRCGASFELCTDVGGSARWLEKTPCATQGDTSGATDDATSGPIVRLPHEGILYQE